MEKEINNLITHISDLKQEISLAADNEVLANEYLSLLSELEHKLNKQAKGLDKSFLKKDIFVFCQGVKSGLNIYKYIMLTISFIIFLSPVKIPSVKAINRAIIGTVALTGGLMFFLSTLLVKKRINTEEKSSKVCVSSEGEKRENLNWNKTNSELKRSNLFFSSPSTDKPIEILPLNEVYGY